MLTVITGGELFDPAPRGTQTLLLANDRIEGIGHYDPRRIAASGLECEVVDARGCVVVPGLIDPHMHFQGAGGEHGFASRTEETRLEQIVRAGITTAVGCMGSDGVARHLTSLLAKAHALEEQGISTFIYTGNYSVPPVTITGSVPGDLVIVDKVIGVGEIAIADPRSSSPTTQELARLVSEAAVGGSLSGKAGITHFHAGPDRQRLGILSAMLEEYEVQAEKVYVTHINRTEELISEAVALARRGAYVDIDSADPGLGGWVRSYRDRGGRMDRLTISSDTNGTPANLSPESLWREFVTSIHEHRLSLEEMLPIATTNTADVLKLKRKGRFQVGMDADVLILRADSLEPVHLFAKGRQLISNGDLTVQHK